MRPVKVLLVSSHPVQYAVPLFRRYTADPRLDVTVAYCSLQGAEPGVDPEFGVEVAWDVPLLDRYPWVHPPNRALRPALRGFWSLVNPGLWRIVTRGDFDVVVCFGYRAMSFWIAALAAKLSGAGLVFTTDAHNLAPRDCARWKVPVKRLVLPWVFRLADAAFGPSTRTLSFLRSLGVDEERVFLTPYVVDTQFFATAATRAGRAATRMAWGAPAETPVALFVGKLVSWKRPEDLLRALAAVPEMCGILVGEGPLRPRLQPLADRLGIQGRVRFLGFLNQRGLPSVYAAADVLVLPSEHEPFGLVVNEAFACGLPAVVSEACGAAGDLVVDGETGFVVPVGDIEALAARLGLLARDPALRAAMGAKARDRIAGWGPEQNAEAFARACVAIATRKQRKQAGGAIRGPEQRPGLEDPGAT